MPNLSLIGWCLETIPDGWLVGWLDGGELIIVLKLLAGIELGNKLLAGIEIGNLSTQAVAPAEQGWS